MPLAVRTIYAALLAVWFSNSRAGVSGGDNNKINKLAMTCGSYLALAVC